MKFEAAGELPPVGGSEPNGKHGNEFELALHHDLDAQTGEHISRVALRQKVVLKAVVVRIIDDLHDPVFAHLGEVFVEICDALVDTVENQSLIRPMTFRRCQCLLEAWV